MSASGKYGSANDERRQTHLYRVESSDASGSTRRLKLGDGRSAAILFKTHRFALAGKGDDVEIDPTRPGRAYISSKESPSDRIQFAPALECEDIITLGEDPTSIRITEIVTDRDLAAYEYLERFHYKTSAIAQDEAPRPDSGGRRAILVAFAEVDGQWHPAGYIELQMPLLMVKPRHDLFNKGFQHPARPIQWARWDQHAIKSYVNLIVRVARVVTAPDLRGIGLARTLLNAAKRYSRERWHIGGRRPIFMEISAEMLNHVDFVSSAGFRLVGTTEGNAERVLKDLHYMSRGYEVASGIMSLQKLYVTKLRKLCDKTGRRFEEALTLLQDVIEGRTAANSLSTSEWYILRSIIRSRIPYYLCALDDAAEKFLTESLGPTRRPRPILQGDADAGHLRVSKLSVRSSFELPRSDTVRTILEAFGLAGDTIRQTILEPFDLLAGPGNIVFVSGASGSGKSMLLRALDAGHPLPHVTLDYAHRELPSGGAAWLEPIHFDAPLIEYFAGRHGPERAMAALNLAGLSEAFIYLKPFALLSRGQRYRAMLAELSLSRANLWLIDEFGADLDPVSAKIVAHNLRRLVVRLRKIAVVAAANHGHYLSALHPTKIIALRQGAPGQVLSFRGYRDELQSIRR
jgi:ABC-type transport system involved in cytochrome c biogenesis ATPase subunit/GNAT superfamily N-acetyltransferase